MSSPSSAVAAKMVSTAQEATTDDTVCIVITALLLYDVILTSGKEYRYIWRSSKSWFSRGLYVWNRYMYLLATILDVGTIPSMSDAILVPKRSSNVLSDILNLIGPAMFTTLRIYALSRQNKVLVGVVLVLSMAPFVINASTAYQNPPINLPAPLGCTLIDTASRSLIIGWESESSFDFTQQYGRLVIASRASLILVDSLAAAVTWAQTRAAIQMRTGTMKRPSLEQVMWKNGTVYFCTLVSLNVVDMVLVILSIAIAPGDISSYVVAFVDPISSILNSRFLLALHETSVQLQGAADASLSSLSLRTGRCDHPRAGSPELPAFLGVIGGSIHSSHDDDDGGGGGGDLGSLGFAPPLRQDGEHQTEHEGESVESSRGEYPPV
ncbi:uncharacterized protein TRAVEDRAFT_49609 [Trametes versicolor FP-101664 SS1]|uniref:uncharacterized protein n=1 Tax=Trametes versicolor (strain FP-101664) TaxID=717944 RepID=UPI0004622E19|nr:uncharacterized protein TRAVEDRAFT_49609 [Trametes versicolor FP-101664 SS1]EIW56788.1 hypothetical protein TRAVEDRAFT_49609 [Trametes versicolor FP-101664 SS1]